MFQALICICMFSTNDVKFILAACVIMRSNLSAGSPTDRHVGGQRHYQRLESAGIAKRRVVYTERSHRDDGVPLSLAHRSPGPGQGLDQGEGEK